MTRVLSCLVSNTPLASIYTKRSVFDQIINSIVFPLNFVLEAHVNAA